MRTKLRDLMKMSTGNEPEKSFEQIVNELLRIGLGIDEKDKGRKASE